MNRKIKIETIVNRLMQDPSRFVNASEKFSEATTENSIKQVELVIKRFGKDTFQGSRLSSIIIPAFQVSTNPPGVHSNVLSMRTPVHLSWSALPPSSVVLILSPAPTCCPAGS